jgi:predicted  nucleic acid-binding Zn-ribbon protein
MKEEIDKLIRYQQVITRCWRCPPLWPRGPRKFRRSRRDSRLCAMNWPGSHETVEQLKKEYRTLDAAFQNTERMIGKIAEKRDAVKTNREYRALFKEEDQLRFSQSKAEDRMLAMLDEIEAAEAVVHEKEAETLRVEEETRVKKSRLEDEIEQNRQQLMELKKKQASIAEILPTDMLSKFNAVKQRQPFGIVVVPVTDATCGGCNMNIPPQMFNELQKYDSLRYCPHCQRIIYWKPSNNDDDAS